MCVVLMAEVRLVNRYIIYIFHDDIIMLINTMQVHILYNTVWVYCSFKEKSEHTLARPSEHPPVMGGKMSKRLGGIKRLHIQNLFMAFKQVPR